MRRIASPTNQLWLFLVHSIMQLNAAMTVSKCHERGCQRRKSKHIFVTTIITANGAVVAAAKLPLLGKGRLTQMIQGKGIGGQRTNIGGGRIQTCLNTRSVACFGFELSDATLLFQIPQTDVALLISNAEITRFSAKGDARSGNACSSIAVGCWILGEYFAAQTLGWVTGGVCVAKGIQHRASAGGQEDNIFPCVLLYGSCIGATSQNCTREDKKSQ